ncbi:MAG: serine hydrolase domain-containing protein [Saprospiraceae bacterium]
MKKVIFLFLLLNHQCYTQITTLKLHQKISKEFKAGQVDKYIIPLIKGQFASINIKQASVGLAYSVYAPIDSLTEISDFNALFESEIVTIDAPKSGDYRVEVFWDYGRPQAGKYSILLDKLSISGKSNVEKANQLMEAWYPDINAPGAAIMVVQNGKSIYKSTKGLADLENKIPITNNSAFELASVSKQFVGFAIAFLIDEGKISLSDDIRKYLPELPEFEYKISVSNLVYHTSGLFNWDQETMSMGYQNDDVVRMDMIKKMLMHHTKLHFKPGDRFSYCNTGYNILAMTVEKISGETFANWMQMHAFNPLGMKNTFINDRVGKLFPHKVNSYESDEHGFYMRNNNYAAPGSTGVVTSIDDLLLWTNNYTNHKVGNENVFKIINSDGFTSDDKKTPGGFGQFVNYPGGIKKIDHMGLTLGYRTGVARFPDQKIAVIFLSNTGDDATYQHFYQMCNVFLKNVKTEPIKLSPFPDLNEFLVKTKPILPEISKTDLSAWSGIYYSDELNVSYKINFEEGVLSLDLPRLETVYLIAEGEDSFVSTFQKNTDRQFVFHRNIANKITGFTLNGGGERGIEFEKVR